MILRVQQGLADEGVAVSLSQLCRWFELPRRTVNCKTFKVPPKVAPPVCRAHHGTDRGVAIVWLQDRGTSAGLQQKYRATDFPDQGLAGSQMGYWHATTDPGSCPLWPQRPTSDGRPIFVVSGQVATAGPRWRW